ncbi:response regulator [Cyanobacteria bacterium FACHB-502]|nr:response regulator [Cyanobacteria bacterium FACHB-502]MBD2027877.1 response regulator [Leptolyngbya sp. FACHB-711]
MDNEQIGLHFQVIRRWIAALQQGDAVSWQELDAVLEDLQVNCEEMQSNLEAAEIVQEGLLQQIQQLAQRYYHYHDLFQALPIAYLTTDSDGVILEANEAIAQLLNVPQYHLLGKPFTLYLSENNYSTFRTQLNELLNELSHRKKIQAIPERNIQVLQINLCPRNSEPVTVKLQIDAVWSDAGASDAGAIKELRIAVQPMHRLAHGTTLKEPQQDNFPAIQQQFPEAIRLEGAGGMFSRLQSLDGLRVLVVDDEADIREFITAVFESHGIEVRAVASAAEALAVLEPFRPDVLLSDIRMPGEDGYKLIQQIRNLEAEQGGHLLAAAITAYQDEDREKSLKAGYEAHLHKLAQPNEWVEMVVQLAGQTSNLKLDF